MERVINVGVVGYGYWGPNLVRNFSIPERSRVARICDSREERAQRAGHQYPGVAVTSRYEDLLEDPAIDLIACATPVSSHYHLGKAALEAGKHLLLEKPMASSSAEARALLAIATERGLRIFVDHTFIFTPAVQRMKAMIDGGELGQLYYYDSTRINLGLFQPDVDVVWDLAPHDLSILDFLLEGQLPEAVSCSGATRFGKMADQAYLALTYADNFTAHVHVNWLAPVKTRQVLLCAERRMLVYDEITVGEKLRVYDRGIRAPQPNDPYQHMISYRDGDMWAPKLENREALAIEVKNVIDTLLGLDEPLVDGRRGYRVVRLLEILSESLREGGHPVAVRPADFALEPIIA